MNEMVEKPDRTDIIERGGPGNRYYRFSEKLGVGAYKQVWLAYDSDTGNEVAWNTVNLRKLPPREKKRIQLETLILKTLRHPNIIRFYHVWQNPQMEQIIFTTELIHSGTLKQYIQKVKSVKIKVIKRWCRQILQGLHYLHSQTPPIIHRDIKCDNIFVNGGTGEILIGDLGLSTMRAETHAKSVLGTPEFMAPELYDEHYTEKVDIYAFGMCVLEMVTNEYPFEECQYPAQIFKKVSHGEKPQALERILDPRVKEFIGICLSPEPLRLSAKDLLNHPFLFFKGTDYTDNFPCPMTPTKEAEEVKKHDSYIDRLPENNFEIQHSEKRPLKSKKQMISCSMANGKDPNQNYAALTLIMNFEGKKKEIKFQFRYDFDTPDLIAEEMVRELGLSDDKKDIVSHAINNCIQTSRNNYLKIKNNQTSPQNTPKNISSLKDHQNTPKDHQNTPKDHQNTPKNISSLKDHQNTPKNISSPKEFSPPQTPSNNNNPTNGVISPNKNDVLFLLKEYFKNYKVAEIKKLVSKHGGDWNGCFEKDDLISLLYDVAPKDVITAYITKVKQDSSIEIATEGINSTRNSPQMVDTRDHLASIFQDAIEAHISIDKYDKIIDNTSPSEISPSFSKKDVVSPSDKSESPFSPKKNKNESEKSPFSSKKNLKDINSNIKIPIVGQETLLKQLNIENADQSIYFKPLNSDVSGKDKVSEEDISESLSENDRQELENLKSIKLAREQELLDKFRKDKETIDQDIIAAEKMIRQKAYQRMNKNHAVKDVMAKETRNISNSVFSPPETPTNLTTDKQEVFDPSIRRASAPPVQQSKSDNKIDPILVEAIEKMKPENLKQEKLRRKQQQQQEAEEAERKLANSIF